MLAVLIPSKSETLSKLSSITCQCDAGKRVKTFEDKVRICRSEILFSHGECILECPVGFPNPCMALRVLVVGDQQISHNYTALPTRLSQRTWKIDQLIILQNT